MDKEDLHEAFKCSNSADVLLKSRLTGDTESLLCLNKCFHIRLLSVSCVLFYMCAEHCTYVNYFSAQALIKEDMCPCTQEPG